MNNEAKLNRREARERVFLLVYEMNVQKEKPSAELIADTAGELEFSVSDYIKGTVLGIREKAEELDKLISSAAIAWKLERLSAVSHAIMQLAVYEMLYVDDVPFPVAINEAVELSKKYDHDKAPRFINGILNKIAENTGLKTPKQETEPKTEASDK